MFSSNRSELRNIFFSAWEKHQKKLPTDLLEAELITIILAHPEYHAFLNDPDTYQQYEFNEDNPFLHLSLHLALREQIKVNRPVGVQDIYQQLHEKLNDSLKAEHKMLLCLQEILWEAQQTGKAPDEKKYLSLLKLL